MIKEYVCIICPNSCKLKAEILNNKINVIEEGNCTRGKNYIVTEITNPLRTLTSSVYVEKGSLPLVSVRTTSPIPRSKIFKAMEELKKIKIKAPINRGDIIIKNFLGFDVDLIATKSIAKAI